MKNDDTISLQQKFSNVWPLLNERSRRLMAANEARSLGYGGVSRIRNACGLSRKAIAKGIREIADGSPMPGRIRRPGAGRKSIVLTDPKLLADIQRFNERCLKRFIDFEREILRLRDQLAEASALHESTGSQQMLLLIHPDPALREALLEPAKAMGVIVEQVFTGGEALDKAGQLDLDGLICSDLLPDLDGQMVLSSLKGELPYIDAIQLRGWGREDAEAVWFDDPEREEASRALAGLDDLLAIIKEVAGQRAKRAADKRLARVFKKKHKEFMHNYAEIKLRILDALSSRSPS